MCEVYGDTPDPNKMPPEYDSFPSYVHVAMEIYNALPDTYSGGMAPVYTGKNLSSLQVLFDLFRVDTDDRLVVFEVIRFLDTKAREQSMRDAEKANKKASRK